MSFFGVQPQHAVYNQIKIGSRGIRQPDIFFVKTVKTDERKSGIVFSIVQGICCQIVFQPVYGLFQKIPPCRHVGYNCIRKAISAAGAFDCQSVQGAIVSCG